MQEIAITVDAVVFCKWHNSHQVLLVQRKNQPFQGQWALPGGFVETDEDLEQAAIRELEEETGLKLKRMKQVFAFGALHRDPRQRVVTVAYCSILNKNRDVQGASDVSAAQWFELNQLPELAFDHAEIIKKATENLE